MEYDCNMQKYIYIMEGENNSVTCMYIKVISLKTCLFVDNKINNKYYTIK